jgi:hypothetical protein
MFLSTSADLFICRERFAFFGPFAVPSQTSNSLSKFPLSASIGTESVSVRVALRVDRVVFRVDRVAFRVDRVAFRVDRVAFRVDRGAFRVDRGAFRVDRRTDILLATTGSVCEGTGKTISIVALSLEGTDSLSIFFFSGLVISLGTTFFKLTTPAWF